MRTSHKSCTALGGSSSAQESLFWAQIGLCSLGNSHWIRGISFFYSLIVNWEFSAPLRSQKHHQAVKDFNPLIALLKVLNMTSVWLQTDAGVVLRAADEVLNYAVEGQKLGSAPLPAPLSAPLLAPQLKQWALSNGGHHWSHSIMCNVCHNRKQGITDLNPWPLLS